MKLQITAHDLSRILDLRDPMVYVSLDDRHRRELTAFHEQLTTKIVEQGVADQLLQGLFSNSTDCAVTVEIESYEVKNYRRIATDLEEPFASPGQEIEAYYNELFRDWLAVAQSWEHQVPDRHL